MDKNVELRVHKIEKSISDVCCASSRNPEDVTLICVSKSVGIETTEEVVLSGITNFAENRIEPFLEKKAYFKNRTDLVWHFIGNLQRRKVKNVINEVDYFHALDSLRLAEEIQKRANHTIKCFLQINVSGEESKRGIKPNEAVQFLKDVQPLVNIKVVGLMTMAPIDAVVPELHHYFSELRDLRDSIQKREMSHAPCTELSMGMSQDYKIAVEEGSTFVRIGTAFFN
ncbi:YggS family pyridoxal phosphate-dependent enzyme [Vagococcus vulneris]|uniref:Pyridoxal phosphate homeostasis protein n=1 Tax=Vagococcus vulneris TaxID=1977869 RepID=A0A429ZWB0_9ENTE|nr:YggS family pyridoxal phosphate-dependent enzyme [Vagococcus vulneris]RST98034.1 YggS family pyridoxal phosphate enzyme [Vagococcus vulneris]